MGKVPYSYTDSEETEDTSGSEIFKKKKFSILKCTNGNAKKKKCKLHSKSEPDDSDFRSRSRSRSRSSQKMKYKLHGILKHDRDRESSDEEDEYEAPKPFRSQDKYLVGRVPRPAGAKPGRGGGVALIVRKNVSGIPAQQSSTSSTKKKKLNIKRLSRKKSY